jgi:hypothetical protein
VPHPSGVSPAPSGVLYVLQDVQGLHQAYWPALPVPRKGIAPPEVNKIAEIDQT